jgi:hypothetical protein
MSGASGKTPAAIHVTPEAADGGPLAYVQDGDIIRRRRAGELKILVDEASRGLGLVGDIGGTNARFALVEFDGQDPRLIEPTTFKGEDYGTAEDAIADYLQKVGVSHPDQAVVAVAGPIEHGSST